MSIAEHQNQAERLLRDAGILPIVTVDSGLEKLGCLIGANAALGIQVIVLPGRVIAPNSIFAPRVTIEKNLPTGRYRHAQQLEAF